MAKRIERYSDTENNFRTRFQEIVFHPEPYLQSLQRYFYKKEKEAIDPESKKHYHALAEEVIGAETIADDMLAAITDRHKSNVGRWRNEKTPTIPSAEVVTKLAEAFGITTDYLLGVSNAPYIELAKEGDVFRKYGIDAEGFMALDALYKSSHNEKQTGVKGEVAHIDYEMTVRGLNYLLSEKSDKHGSMSILCNIGYFLAQTRFDGYYYFDSDDVDNLFSGLFEAILPEGGFTPELVKQDLEFFFKNCPKFTIDDKVMSALDTIRDRLKEYKEQLDPDFFTPSDAPAFFEPKKRTEEEEPAED